MPTGKSLLPRICPVSLNALRAGLTILSEERHYARDHHVSATSLATRIRDLRKAGMPEVALRWLSGVGYAQHLLETTEAGQAERSFVPGARFTLWPRSCFVLTSKGERFSQELLDIPARTLLLSCPRRLNRLLTRLPATPVWDGVRRELRARHLVVKHFDRAAPAQETVLAAFQEEEWPPYIDDPLPRNDVDRWERLHDTIKRLNHGQTPCLITFHGDGTGLRIGWKWRRSVKPTCLLLGDPPR